MLHHMTTPYKIKWHAGPLRGCIAQAGQRGLMRDSDAVQRWSSTAGRRSVTRAQLTLHWCSPGPSGICHANGIRHAVAARIIVAMRHEPSATRGHNSKSARHRSGHSKHSSGHSKRAQRWRRPPPCASGECGMCAPVRSATAATRSDQSIEPFKRR